MAYAVAGIPLAALLAKSLKRQEALLAEAAKLCRGYSETVRITVPYNALYCLKTRPGSIVESLCVNASYGVAGILMGLLREEKLGSMPRDYTCFRPLEARLRETGDIRVYRGIIAVPLDGEALVVDGVLAVGSVKGRPSLQGFLEELSRHMRE